MTESEPIKAVIRMQDYIHQNIDRELSIDEICSEAGYSKRHSLRLFKKYLGKTVFGYIRDLRLSMATRKLTDPVSRENILDIALDSGFESHEGFTKAFESHYSVLPNEYRKRCFPAGYTAPTPISYYYLMLRTKGMNEMSTMRTVTATFIKKPARKLIVRRGVLATDYLSYCDEVGCDIWDVLGEVSGRLEEVALVILPDFLVPEGTSKACCGVEVPQDFDGDVPAGCDVIGLGEHMMLCFQGAPYEDEEWYCGAHEEVAAAVENYKPELFGYRFAYDEAPEFHFAATAKDGCRRLVPVAEL